MATSESGDRYAARYHVPRSQVWEGSRGRQQGKVHLHVLGQKRQLQFTTASARVLERGDGETLCGKQRGWYEVPVENGHADAERCPKCVERAERYGVEWPEAAA
jgi:hypothetical protein